MVGGGYTGLWTALRAKERDPGRDVLLLEAGACGDQASGRNGGFASASLTHGFGNGGPVARGARRGRPARRGEPPRDRRDGAPLRHRLPLGADRRAMVATAPHQVDRARRTGPRDGGRGHRVELLDGQAASWSPPRRTSARSWTRRGPRWSSRPGWPGGCATPAFAWACGSTSITGGRRAGEQPRRRPGARPRAGTVRTASVALATNAFPTLLRRLRLMTVPGLRLCVDERAAVTGAARLGRVAGRQGVGDSGNLFHYYRLTRDNRILWGGYDAVYHYGSQVHRAWSSAPRHTACSPSTSSRPSRSWTGCVSRTAGAASSTPRPGSPRSSAPRTGAGSATRSATRLGVAASRFGAEVMLDLLAGRTPSGPGHGWCASGRFLPARAVALRRRAAHPPVAGTRRRARGSA